MELKQFIDDCLAQIDEGIGDKDDFILSGVVHFELPIDTKGGLLNIAFGDQAKSSGLPKIVFDVKKPLKINEK